MHTETFYSSDISALEEKVENFILDKIVLDVRYDRNFGEWAAYVSYIDIFEEE